MRLEKVDFELQNIAISEGKPRFKARSISKEFVPCDEALERLSKNSVGKPLVWRHEHPADIRFNENHIYGEVVRSEVVDGFIESEYELYTHTQDHKKLVKILKDRDELKSPLSISMRFRTYFNEEGQPIHYDVIEHSATPTPACKECVVIDIQNEENNMNELEEKIKEIEELEEQLTKKDKLLEELEQEVLDIKNSVKKKDEMLEEEKTEKQKIEEKLIAFKDKLNEQSKLIDEMKEQNKMDKLQPYIERILEEDGDEMRDLYENKALRLIREDKFDEAKSFLNKRLEKVAKDKVMPVTKSFEQSAQESQEDVEDLSLEEEKEKAKKAFAHFPELYEKLYGDK